MSTKNKCDKAAPLLLLLKGHPGSGKSTLAKQVARHLHLPLADKDDARDCFRAAEEQYGPAGTWDLNALSYEVMFSVAASQLACQQSVVVDSPLSKVELYQKAVAVAKKHNADVAVIECQPSDVGIWQQRLEARGKQELDRMTSHKPTTWAELTDLICRYNKKDKWSTDGTVKIQHYLLLDTSFGTAASHLSLVKQFFHDKGLARDAMRYGDINV
ncbi:MAG: hypothetical protein FRX49_00043 [Trebouxia sp. A1-2]|nr:MAG: hypothetical protein FRX49_00043 [Trebouxia sp. A1-2]